MWARASPGAQHPGALTTPTKELCVSTIGDAEQGVANLARIVRPVPYAQGEAEIGYLRDVDQHGAWLTALLIFGYVGPMR